VADYQARAIARDRALLQERQKLLEERGAGQITPEEKAYAAYQDAQKQAREQQRGAMAPVASVLGAQIMAQARNEVADLQASVRAAAGKDKDVIDRQNKAEIAYEKDPEVQTLKESLKGISAQMDPAKARAMITRMKEIQAEKYRLYGVEVPGLSAAAAPAASASGQKVVKLADLPKLGK